MDNCIKFPHLLKAEILDGLDAGFKKDFLNECATHHYENPTAIIEQGEAASGMFIIAHGGVDVTYIGEDGQQLFVTRSRVGATLGETESISDEPNAATATTAANTTLLLCSKPQLFQSLQTPGFIKNLTRIFHKRLVKDNWLNHIGQFGAVEKRLRGYLYVLSESRGKVEETQSFLASVVGCSRQTVNRELANLREAGIIEQNGSEICVVDRVALGAGLHD